MRHHVRMDDKAQQRRLSSLLIHHSDMREAVRYARGIQAHFAGMENVTHASERARHAAVQALITMYARPFRGSRGVCRIRVEDELAFPGNDPFWLGAHRFFLEWRDQEFAHSDASQREVLIDPDFSLVPAGVAQTQEIVPCLGFTKQIERMADHLAGRLHELLDRHWREAFGAPVPEVTRARIEITQITATALGKPEARSGHPVVSL